MVIRSILSFSHDTLDLMSPITLTISLTSRYVGKTEYYSKSEA